MTSSKPGKRRTGLAPGYLHGFTRTEQDRLVRQARFLEPYVFGPLDFYEQDRILEVGCGVGAQTELLLKHFPHLRIEGVDASARQIAKAKTRLTHLIRDKRVRFRVADALRLPYRPGTFDGAFLCWFLEHVPKPVEILKQIRHVLKPGAIITCTEVLNATFYVHPYSPATLQYWMTYNDHQWNLGGDPFVGAKLANYLGQAGYQGITTRPGLLHWDNRTPRKRAEMIAYWAELLLSGAPSLITAGRVTRELVAEMRRELTALTRDPNAVFYYNWIQARAEVY